jgi:tryptophan synthase alpha chain
MNRIAQAFKKCADENRKALVIFVSAGNPDLATTEKLIVQAAEAGADIVELGVPFSDPMADGPVIQEASMRALQSGTTLADIIAMAARIRKVSAIPMALFSYYNVILSYGVEKAAADCKDAGIDAWLTVDVPFEESAEIIPYLDKYGLCLIPLVAPTTPEARARQIVKDAKGFVYYITVAGVTGVRKQLSANLEERLNELRKFSPVPVVAGFGVSSPEMAAKTAARADGIVVGSALVKIMNEAASPDSGISKSLELIRELAAALKRVR